MRDSLVSQGHMQYQAQPFVKLRHLSVLLVTGAARVNFADLTSQPATGKLSGALIHEEKGSECFLRESPREQQYLWREEWQLLGLHFTQSHSTQPVGFTTCKTVHHRQNIAAARTLGTRYSSVRHHMSELELDLKLLSFAQDKSVKSLRNSALNLY